MTRQCRTILAFVGALTLASSAARAEGEFCLAYAEAAETTARARDNGMPLADVLQVVGTHFTNPVAARLMREQAAIVFQMNRIAPADHYTLAHESCMATEWRNR